MSKDIVKPAPAEAVTDTTPEVKEESWWSKILAKLLEAVKAWWAEDKEKVIEFLKKLGKDLWEAIKEAFKKLLEKK